MEGVINRDTDGALSSWFHRRARMMSNKKKRNSVCTTAEIKLLYLLLSSIRLRLFSSSLSLRRIAIEVEVS